MRVLLLSRYGRLGASSRYRSYQYLPFLEAGGHKVEVLPLLGDDYLLRLYAGRTIPVVGVAASYLKRLSRLLRRRGLDLIWVEYEAFPWLPAVVDLFLLKGKIPYIVDYDDAVFHRYDRHASSAVRWLLGRKIDRIMRSSASVIAGNEYLADRARSAGAGVVHVIPTVVDPARYALARRRDRDVFTVGWIGTPVTAPYLQIVREALERLAARVPCRVVTVGAGRVDLGHVRVEDRAWAEESEAASLEDMDVGIMPLPDTPWERGKCGHKLIKYMASGLPVVASPVGVNATLVHEGVNGFLASTGDEWLRALEALQADSALRASMGSAGRACVEAEYSLARQAPILEAALRQAGTRD